MVLSLRPVLGTPGARQAFSFSLELTKLRFPFGNPFVRPVLFEGEVKNRAGMLILTAQISSTLHLRCDRCDRPFERAKTLSLSQVLVENPGGELADDMIAIQGEQIDLEETLTPFLILDLDMKNLCSEDCPGLCPSCGAWLGDGPCACPKRPADPRWEALRGFRGSE